MPVSLIPQKTSGSVSLATPEPSVPDEVLDNRAQQAEYALDGRILPEQVRASVWTGHENRLREQISYKLQLEDHEERIRQIAEVSRMAGQEGRSLTQAEFEYIQNLPPAQLRNPNIVLEELAATRFVEELSDENDPAYLEAQEEDPETAQVVHDLAVDMKAKQEVARRVLEDTVARWSDNGVHERLWDLGRGMIPGYTWFMQNDRIKDAGTESAWLGDNLAAQIRGLYFLPADQFEVELRRAVEDLVASNTLEGLTFASSVVDYSSSDQLWDNIFTGLDIADVALVGTGTAIAASRYASKAKNAIAASSTGNDAVTRLAAQGDIESAARVAAQARLETLIPSTDIQTSAPEFVSRPEQNITKLLNETPDALNPSAFFSTPSSLPAERSARLAEQVAHDRELLMASFLDVSHVDRLNPQARDAAFKRAEEKINQVYGNLEDAIVNIRHIAEGEEVFGGVDYVQALVGRKDGTSFARREQAFFHANNLYRLPEGSYDIVQEGGNYFISLTKNVDETDLAIQDLRVATEYGTQPNFYNTFLSLLSGSDQQLAKAHNDVRSVATYGGLAIMNRMAEVGKRIGSLSRNEATRLTGIMDEARLTTRQIMTPDGPETIQGVFYKNQAELEGAYMKKYGQLPSDQESLAYASFRNLMDYDYLMRNVSMYRDKARLGMEEFSIGVQLPQGETRRYGSSDFFEGRVVDNLPDLSQGEYGVGWFDSTAGKMGYTVPGTSIDGFGTRSKVLKDLIDSGEYKIIQVGNPRDQKLTEIFDTKGELLNYVVVKNTKTRPLSARQVPYAEGGHWMYPHTGHYMKQVKSHKTGFGRRVIDGDVTGMYFPTTQQGNQFTKAFNEAREMLKAHQAGQISAKVLSDFIASNLPYKGIKDFSRLFGKTGPFDIDTPFVLTSSGQKASDVLPPRSIFAEELVDPSESVHNLSTRIDGSFAQERNEQLFTVGTSGTQQNPVYNLRRAPLLDSRESLARSGQRLAKSRHYSDYKHREIENWATQFAQYLDADAADVIHDPIRYIKNPIFRESTPWPVKQAAKTSRRNILNLLQMYSDGENAWRWAAQKIADNVYRVGGERGLKLVEPLLWTPKTNPASMARWAVFSGKLGLFNPVQLPLQASAASMAMAIDGSPVRAAQSVFAYWGLRMRGLSEGTGKNQGHISSKIAQALGMPADTMDEMYDAWRRSGLYKMDGAHSMIDDYMNPGDLFGNPAQRIGKASTVFFREGNDIHRGVGFSLSYLRWKGQNPGKRLDNRALTEITSRAKAYYLNMDRSGSAAWQTPQNWMAQIASTPTQFFGFQARVADALLGKQLSGGEKFRLFAMNSLLWGIPIGGAGSVAGIIWPVGDEIKKNMMDNGYDAANADVVQRVLMDGIVDLGVENMFGTDFNVAERFGPGGVDWLRLLIVDNDFLGAMGAAPNFMLDVIGSTQPITQGIMSVFYDKEGSYHQVAAADVLTALRQISTVSNATRAWQVWTAGQWISNNESLIAQYEGGDPVSTIAAALGLTPQEVSDTYLRMESIEAHDDAKNATISEALVYFERGLRAYRGQNKEQGDAFFKYANVLLGMSDLTPMEQGQVFRRAIEANESLVDNINREWIMRDPSTRLPEAN